MSYQEAISYIHSSHRLAVKFGLENIKTLLSYLGNPHLNLKFIHIAGTNGKGSISSFVSHILIAAGFKTGLFTSPFLMRFNERMRVNQEEISDTDLAHITSMVRDKVEKMKKDGFPPPTEFELITAIGFLYFVQKQCDFVVLEVGLGGRLDATNVILNAEVSVIASIAMDHMELLGYTLSSIAFEKAGILKPNGTLVLYPQEPEALHVINEQAKHKNNRVIMIEDLEAQVEQNESQGNIVQILNYKDFKGIPISLLGRHQIGNAKVAIEVAISLAGKGYFITTEHIKEGLSATTWPGRFEILFKNPYFILDGAHNAQSMAALCDTIKVHFAHFKKIFILGILQDKDATGMLELLCPIAHAIYTITPASPRAISAVDLKKMVERKFPPHKVHILDDIKKIKDLYDSFEIEPTKKDPYAKKNEEIDSPILWCACGSLYFIGEIRTLLMDQER
jgi:dihydrofolate synthase / folylpolyglutamate synthase